MAVGLQDPETRAVVELVETVAPEATRFAEEWEERVDWAESVLTIELTSWTPRADVVGRAIAAVDQRWRLASGIVSPAAQHGLPLGDLIAVMPGLVVIDIGRGSLHVWLDRAQQEARKNPIATLAALVAIFGGAGGAALKITDHANAAVPVEHTAFIVMSAETRVVVADRVTTLPDGCTVTFESHVVTPQEDITVKVRLTAGAGKNPVPAAPPDWWPAPSDEHPRLRVTLVHPRGGETSFLFSAMIDDTVGPLILEMVRDRRASVLDRGSRDSDEVILAPETDDDDRWLNSMLFALGPEVTDRAAP